MKQKIIFLFCMIVLSIPFLKTTIASPDTTNAPIVVELFTSQSCSSCPPADKVLSELGQQQNVIALSCHVTYWNHLHWVDDLSHEFCTQRQRNYARLMRSNRVYTPQMIVNGHDQFVGSKRSLAEETVKKAKPLKALDIQIHDKELKLTLPALPKDEYIITLFGRTNDETRKITRGENSGKTITYQNSITFMDELGNWDGSKKQLGHEIEKTSNSYVVIISLKDTGRIIAVSTNTP